jgi:hypothetical protein
VWTQRRRFVSGLLLAAVLLIAGGVMAAVRSDASVLVTALVYAAVTVFVAAAHTLWRSERGWPSKRPEDYR